VRELKNGLSGYLRRVRKGETIVVTDRGHPVARIIPAGIAEPIVRLMVEGRVTWSGKKFKPSTRLIRPRPGDPVSRYITEDRF
jgi:antitoxin (DNA-binding transcriptional repressor) of toxin-antitoxin stability system